METHRLLKGIDELPDAELPAKLLKNIREIADHKNTKKLAEELQRANELYAEVAREKNLPGTVEENRALQAKERLEKYKKNMKKKKGGRRFEEEEAKVDEIDEKKEEENDHNKDSDIVTLQGESGGEINVIPAKIGKKKGSRAYVIWEAPALATSGAKKKKARAKNGTIMKSCDDYYRCEKMRVGRELDIYDENREELELNIVFDTRSNKISVTVSDAAVGLPDEDVMTAIKFAKVMLAQKNPLHFPDVKIFDNNEDDQIVMNKYANGQPQMYLHRVTPPRNIVEPEKMAQSPVITMRQMNALKRRVKHKGKVSDGILERMGLLKREEFKGISYSPDGTTYVADPVNHIIRVYKKGNTLVRQVGGYGEDDGELQWPSDVVCLSDTEIIVADTDNHRIQFFDVIRGEMLFKFGKKGTEEDEFHSPQALAFDPETNWIYVADYEAHRVLIFTKYGKFMHGFGKEGTGDGEFKHPAGVALSKENGKTYLLVSDSDNHRIQVFNIKGLHLLNFGSFGSDNNQFNHPRMIRIDENGCLLVADRDNNRVQVFTKNFKYKETLGVADLNSPMCALYNTVENCVQATTRWKPELYILR